MSRGVTDYPLRGHPWFVNRSSVVVRESGRAILCHVCRQQIQPRERQRAPRFHENGSRTTRTVAQPVVAMSRNMFVLQHVNCCTKEFFEAELSTSDSDAEAGADA